jgi:hypothetical protein
MEISRAIKHGETQPNFAAQSCMITIDKDLRAIYRKLRSWSLDAKDSRCLNLMTLADFGSKAADTISPKGTAIADWDWFKTNAGGLGTQIGDARRAILLQTPSLLSAQTILVASPTLRRSQNDRA